ncbi:MAG: pseudaminic acid synthase [Frankiaceae bacterium]
MAAPRSVRIGGRGVGTAYPPFVIAEMSGNHNGDLGTAKEIVRAAAEAGAGAVKLQTYTADTMTVDVDLPAFRISEGHELWGGANLYRLYEKAHTPWEWHEPLFDLARELGMLAFSAPFDASAVDFLETLDVPCHKIASSEITDLPLVRRAAETGKPVILSTGMASVGEIDAAVRAARETGNDQLVVLSCTVSYPASPADSHLRGIPLLADTFDTVVGLSDHTPGIGAAIAAVALGASVIEKHLVLSRGTGGVDSAFSLEPAELAALVRESQVGWEALGEVRIGPTKSEVEGLRFRRSLYVVADVRHGDPVTRDNVRSIRPAGGLPPDAIDVVLGRTFRSDAGKGTALTWDLV